MTDPAPASHTGFAAYSDSLAALVQRTGASTFGIPDRHRGTLASATMWRRGVAVTVAHPFRRAPEALKLVTEGGRRIDASLIGVDTTTDLVALRVADDAAPAVTTGDAAAIKVGELVTAVGRTHDGELSASHGMVHRIGGPWQTWLGGSLDRMVRLDGGIHGGMSGGPVASSGGNVFGVATAALSRSHGIVIPAATVDRVLDELLARGHVARAYLGISAQPVEVRGEQGGARTGLLITGLAPGGPSESSGLLVGDIILEIEGRPVTGFSELRQALSGKVGATAQALIRRGGETKTVPLSVGEWPSKRCCH